MEIKGEPDFRFSHTGPNRVAFLFFGKYSLYLDQVQIRISNFKTLFTTPTTKTGLLNWASDIYQTPDYFKSLKPFCVKTCYLITIKPMYMKKLIYVMAISALAFQACSGGDKDAKRKCRQFKHG